MTEILRKGPEHTCTFSTRLQTLEIGKKIQENNCKRGSTDSCDVAYCYPQVSWN